MVDLAYSKCYYSVCLMVVSLIPATLNWNSVVRAISSPLAIYLIVYLYQYGLIDILS